MVYSSWTPVDIFKDSDSDGKDSDSNHKDSDSDSRPQNLQYSDSAHYRPVMLSNITSCIETVCLRKFSGCLVSIFSTPIILWPYSISVFLHGEYSQCLCQGYTCHKLANLEATVEVGQILEFLSVTTQWWHVRNEHFNFHKAV